MLAAALLAGTVPALAACGSGSKPGAITVSVPTATTIANAKTGTRVRCGSVGAYVPAPGHGVAAIGDGVTASAGASLQVQRLRNGSLVVVCSR